MLSRLVASLEGYADNYNVALMYMADHGGSLGENGLCLHGPPYAFAPREQTQVPWMLWLPEQYAHQSGISVPCLKDKTATGHFSQNNFFTPCWASTGSAPRWWIRAWI